jgi:GcrA cell cycle regulator
MRFYDEEEASRVRQWWREGYSASQIATMLGTGRTRNSVIGWVNRYIGPSRKTLRYQPTKKAKAEPKQFHKPAAAGQAAVVRRVEPAPQPPLMLGLDDLKPRQCHYACNNAAKWQEHLFCGAPTPEGSPWCEYHKALVYVPAIPKSRRKRADILFQAGF